ncbi:histidine phosphatase family protein [Lederbergia graminis]|uniref:Histidine phosphatase family protein n=1 Tax=Lederbergia graminis TaxID=735518 RepID=A0ABW0LJQ1_9BACI
MTTICLIRHGETDWNAEGRIQGRTDVPLNQNGLNQAKKCRDFLKNSEWDVIITSPLKRAQQTAEIINEALNLPIIIMDDFIERSYGDAEGMLLEVRRKFYPDGSYPNQEERETLNNRVIAGVERIKQKYDGTKVIIVAHGAVINTLLATFSNGEIGSGKTRLGNACISHIHFQNGIWVIKDYNQINHLTKSNI